MESVAYLGGGCFWGMQELLRRQEGVLSTEVGYCGGVSSSPTYEHHDSHAEAVKVVYDTNRISYRKILDLFFRIHNPTTYYRQGNDVGSSYRSVIFFSSEEEKRQAEEMIALVNHSGRWKDPVVTSLEPYEKFYPAEAYHQDYLQKYPDGYTCHRYFFSSYLQE